MIPLRRAAALALAGLLAAGCADGADDELEMEPETAPETPLAQPAGGTGMAAAPLGVDSLPEGRAYLTDGEGRALYLLEGEPEGRSTCHDACAEEWPPYTVEDTARAGAMMGGPLRSDLVGTLQRDDGTTQLTYGGHAVYYYHGDEGAGQTRGHHVTDAWGEWYLVTPEGEPLEEEGGA